ncbi:MAG: M48 family metalloprotease [Armatimonadota bacterium]|nr:M48 family metalloprotease [bacterium]
MTRYCFAIIALIVLPVMCVGRSEAFSLKDEIKLGEQAAKEVEKEMPPSENEKWQQDIAALGARLVPFVSRRGITYHFKVVQAKEEINAFALPGGNVYFTERMWRIMTPDERGAILAHEITHCDRRHAINMMIKSQQRSLWMLPVIILGGGALGNIAIWGNAAISQRYSRVMEREADELGIQLAAKAGFDPAGSVTSMKKLLNIESNQNRYEISAIFASHPDTKKRIDYLTQQAVALGVRSSELELRAVDDPARLGNIIKRMPEVSTIYARVPKSLSYGQEVAIKKMLWDDDAQALRPKTIALATVLTPGNLPILLVEAGGSCALAEIMEGDGIYPAVASDKIILQKQEQSPTPEQSPPAASPRPLL